MLLQTKLEKFLFSSSLMWSLSHLTGRSKRSVHVDAEHTTAMTQLVLVNNFLSKRPLALISSPGWKFTTQRNKDETQLIRQDGRVEYVTDHNQMEKITPLLLTQACHTTAWSPCLLPRRVLLRRLNKVGKHKVGGWEGEHATPIQSSIVLVSVCWVHQHTYTHARTHARTHIHTRTNTHNHAHPHSHSTVQSGSFKNREKEIHSVRRKKKERKK